MDADPAWRTHRLIYHPDFALCGVVGRGAYRARKLAGRRIPPTTEFIDCRFCGRVLTALEKTEGLYHGTKREELSCRARYDNPWDIEYEETACA